MSWEQLAAGVELPFDPELTIPELHPFPLDVPAPPAVADVERAAHDAVRAAFAQALKPAMTVAVGAGSRGLSGRVELLRGTIAGLRSLGAEPFVVPAMGSHGGATAPGQIHMLESLGMAEESLGCEVRATRDTVVVAHTASGDPIHLNAHAAAADCFLLVNRIKPHTCFKGPTESGCMKMAVVGFAKRPGAFLVHSCGPVEMRDRLLDACAALRATGRLVRARTHRVRPLTAAGAPVRRDRRADRRARRQGHLRHHHGPELHRSMSAPILTTSTSG
jgi:hypothetical protein